MAHSKGFPQNLMGSILLSCGTAGTSVLPYPASPGVSDLIRDILCLAGLSSREGREELGNGIFLIWLNNPRISAWTLG